MNTEEIIEILKQHRDIEEVVLEKSKNLLDIWDNYIHIIYHNETLEKLFWDEKLRNSMLYFQNNDSLDIVNKKGRLLKRFATFYKMSTGEVIPDNIMGIMGDCLQALITKEIGMKYLIDFTDKFDWNDGDFGKSGSCWWGTYGDSLPTFQEGGGWCIRFYDENKSGIGRTWLFPHPEHNVLLGFNSYGIERGKVSKIIKKVFYSHNIELHYSTCDIENSNNSNIPYINGSTGFVLYTDDQSPISNYDLDMEVEEDEEHENCSNCGCRINTDSDSYHWINDECYCEDCTNDKFSFCDKCNEFCDQDEVHEVRDSHSRYDYLCGYCASIVGMTLCDDCNQFTEYIMIAEDSGNAYCEHCSSLWCCEECGNYYEHTETCPDCPQDEDEEEIEETEQDIDPKYENIIIEDGVAYFTNSGETQTTIYRFDNIPGLVVCKNEDWMVYHINTKLAAQSGITTLNLAIESMIKFGELADWALIDQDVLALPENEDLRSKGREIQRYIRSKM